MIKRAAVLNSRQGMHPCLKDGWVKNSIDALNWIKQNNHTLCSSVGMPTWEMITALASSNKIPLELFIPLSSGEDPDTAKQFYQTQFKLDENLTTVIPVIARQESTAKEKLWKQRDKTIAEHADIILPVSIRSNGELDRLTRASLASGKQINIEFKTGYTRQKKKLGYKISPGSVDKNTSAICRDYLIHWTRTSNSAWPDELLIDYYSDITKSDNYPRVAFESLKNIITVRKINATAKNMPGNTPTVSFSDQSLDVIAGLIRWRSRYKQMSFEPYGIGIKKDTAEKLGIKKVTYVDNNQAESENRWLIQSKGKITDWRDEMEYRHHSDFFINNINPDDIILITKTKKEAAIISQLSSVRSYPFTLE